MPRRAEFDAVASLKEASKYKLAKISIYIKCTISSL